jgi:hypothetical protein
MAQRFGRTKYEEFLEKVQIKLLLIFSFLEFNAVNNFDQIQ